VFLSVLKLLVMKRQLTDAIGQVFVTMEYDESQGWIYARWTGEQTDNTVREGSLACLDLVQMFQTSKFLNDSSLVTGTWPKTNEYLACYPIPEAIKAGLRYFAYVVPPGLEGKISVVDLHQRIGELITMKVFLEAKEAEKWLQSVD
jgi:hypothetical protein